MKKILHLLIWLFLAACQSNTTSTTTQTIPITPTATPSLTSQPDTNLIQIIEAYKSLRDIPGHFGGGEPNQAVDQWQGEKHRLMQQIGTHFGKGEYGRAELVALIGPPDHIITEGDDLYLSIESLPSFPSFAAAEEFLIYEWRGTHDFLFFAVQNDKILTADWWYELE